LALDRSAGYPIMLRLENRHCVIVGGGNVAARKIADLLQAGARITVLSPEFATTIAVLADEGQISVQRAAYSPGMLANLRPFLVFAATDSRAVNRQVASEARAIGALVDVVDSGSDSDFGSMSTIRRGPLTIGISTSGGSPALAVHLQERLETLVGPEYGTLAAWLADLRPLVGEQIPSESHRKALWQAIVDSPALDLLRQGDKTAARRVIDELLAGAKVKST
jgi:precorrin-2 dehydrogenase / sirohydrochlorin ferrochelatase